ncbi:MAG: HDOD domain-containing protein [Azoarcus sp.]|jgi:HD-like signal output (HDOD) protein|nr:HDOD domain-containing protein [Azoarcus sp.]
MPSSSQELAASVESLVALPSVYYQVREQLERADATIPEVAHLIETDPALTAGVLRLVNSAFYGLARKIESVERAVLVIGLRQTHEMVLAITISNVFNGIRPQYMDMRRYWIGCMMTAIAARNLAHLTCNPAAGRLFVIGLLADIGHLVMYQTVPEQTIEAQNFADASGEPLFEAERRIVGCDSAQVGAALMECWKLPPSFAEIIAAQATPLRAGEHALEAQLLHVALAVSHADRYSESSEAAILRIDPRVWRNIGLSRDSFSRIREAAEMNLSSCTSMLFSVAG